MNSKTVLMQCAKCGQQFRIKALAGTLRVTCPKCAWQWNWPETRAPFTRAAGAFDDPIGEIWRDLFVQPRLSYAAAAAVLLAGLVLGIGWQRLQQRTETEESPDPLELTNAVPPSQFHEKKAEPSIESLLPSNGIDFNPTNTPGNHL
jgi:DNA-directed RNA polymerase subunit RPC12/RpoP